MPNLEGDNAFLRNVGEELEGKYPGIEERTERLEAEEIGRSILASVVFGGIDPATKRYRNLKQIKLGYVLPTSSENNQHVILFTTGDVMVMEPGGGVSEDFYRNAFEPSLQPYNHHSYGEKSLPVLVREFTQSANHTVIAQNTNPDHVEMITALVSKALIVAREIKARRQQSKKESLTTIFASIDEFLRPNTPKYDLPPEITEK